MPEKPPDDTEQADTEGGFDRRGLLKGISFGAAGLAGAGAAMTNVAARKETEACDFSIDYLVTTPENAPVSEFTRSFDDGPTARMDVVSGITFEPADDPPPIVDDRLPMGYQLTIIKDKPDGREIVTRVFEEFNSRAVAKAADPDAGGNIEIRETVSLNDMGDSDVGYLAVLTLTDYRGPCCSVASNSFSVAETGEGDGGS